MSPGWSSPEIGVEREVHVAADQRWVASGVEVRRGDRLRLVAHGNWFDRGLPGTPDGLHHLACAHHVFGLTRRRCWLPWMSLCMCVGKRFWGTMLVGHELTTTIRRSGRIYLFANDTLGMYFNNTGFVRVQISKLASAR